MPDDVVADYELSYDPRREELLAQAHTSTRDVIHATLAWLDVVPYLRAGELSQAELDAVLLRLLEPADTRLGDE